MAPPAERQPESHGSSIETAGRKQTEQGLSLTDPDPTLVIEEEGRHRGLPNDGAAHYAVAIPPEVVIPFVGTWMKQGHLLIGSRDGDADAVCLAQIAARAGPGEVVQIRTAAPAARNDEEEVLRHFLEDLYQYEYLMLQKETELIPSP